MVLWLQKSSSQADVSELSSVVEHVVKKLRFLVNQDTDEKHRFSKSELENFKFTKKVFNEKLEVINNFVESLPAASRLRSSSKSSNDPFDEFLDNIYKPFITEVANEIEKEIKVDPVTGAFQCLDVRKFPKSKKDLMIFGKGDIKILISHFGEPQEALNPSTLRNNRADPKVDKNTTEQEYEMFKEVAFDMFGKRKMKIEQQIISLSKQIKSTLRIVHNKAKLEKLKDDVLKLKSQQDDMPLSELMASMNKAHRFMFPNILVLLELAIICPISNASVERLFSFLKLVKTKLRNQISDSTLDKVLRIKMEAPDHLEESSLETLVNNFKDYSKDLSKSGQIKINV